LFPLEGAAVLVEVELLLGTALIFLVDFEILIFASLALGALSLAKDFCVPSLV
jgi:hypothetical protein